MNEIIKRIQKGESDLIEKVILINKDFIYSHINMYSEILDDYEDLVQETLYHYIKIIYAYNFNYERFNYYAKLRLYLFVNKYILKNIDKINDEEERFKIIYNSYEKCKNFFKHDPNIDEYSRFHYLAKEESIHIYNMMDDFNVREKSSRKKMTYVIEDTVIEKLDSKIFQKKVLDEILTEKQAEVIKYEYGFLDGDIHNDIEVSDLLNQTYQAIYDKRQHAMKRLTKNPKRLLKYM